MSSVKMDTSYKYVHDSMMCIGQRIIDSGDIPDIILAIGGGGLIPARMLRTIINKPIIVLTINYYDDNNMIREKPRIIQWIQDKEIEGKKVLVVDEINDTGKTLHYVLNKLFCYNPIKIDLAVVYDKTKDKMYPDDYFDKNNITYYCNNKIPDIWVVFEWDVI
jgi:hypoxanthine phosphoribosyltransferase